jgi:Raf kinase inhibitor-like YbhB/YbcL family protein
MALVLAIVMTQGCGKEESSPETRVANALPPTSAPGTLPPSNEEVPTMQLTSNFAKGERIEKRHTGEAEDLSPPLKWSDAPEDTQSFALICDDPDAPSPKKPAAKPWVHWVIFNIPASAAQLPEGISRVAEPEQIAGAKQGRNSWQQDNLGYRGPMPPPGSGTHRYFFKLYALNEVLQLEAGTTDKDKLLEAMQGHILAEGQLVGTYER